MPWGRREECILSVPANYQWELGSPPIPTSERVAVPFEKDFRIPRPLGSLVLDDLYTGVQRSNGWSEMWFRDNAAGVQVVVRSDERFREMVIHASRVRGVLCLEPYSCATDAFNLESRDIDAGMVALEPGARWWGEVSIEVRPV